MGVYSVDKLIGEARRIAVEFRRATGKPLPGVTSEVCLYDAARILDLELNKTAISGYDAVGRGFRKGQLIQIKGRAIYNDSKSNQRLGQIKLDQQWDCLLLVLMNEELEAFEIYAANRDEIKNALIEKTSSTRSKRGIMSIAKFKAISHLVWSRADNSED